MRQAYEKDAGKGLDDDSNEDQDAIKDLISRINEIKKDGTGADGQNNNLQLNDLNDESDTDNSPVAKNSALVVFYHYLRTENCPPLKQKTTTILTSSSSNQSYL